MKYIICLGWLIGMSFIHLTLAQQIGSSAPSLQFPSTSELQTSDLQVYIHNLSDQPLDIQSFRVYKTYDSTAFSHDGTPRLLAPQDSFLLTVSFHPRHNITHNQELLIVTNRGALSIDLKGQGTYSNTYYSSTQNVSEEALKTALKTRINQGALNLRYNGARDRMFMDIDNQRVNGQGASVNTLEGVYSGLLRTNYSSRTDAQDQLNTEHTWPRSLFGNDPADLRKSDLFHIFPTKINANSVRANHPFGVVSSPSWQEGGSKFGQNTFEPRDAHKGAVARAMCYYVLRYNNQNGYLTNQEAILRQWHAQFPPNAIERNRNDAIFMYQKNRNPLIDYPQLLERIHSVSNLSVAPETYTYDLSSQALDFDTLKVGESQTYDWVLVNTGNQDMILDQLSFTQAWIEGPTWQDSTIAPGEAIRIPIKVNPQATGTWEGNMEFRLQTPNAEELTVPIKLFAQDPTAQDPDLSVANWSVHSFVEELLILYTGNQMGLTTDLKIFNQAGQTIWQAREVPRQAEIRVPLSGMVPGVYFLKIGPGGAPSVHKFIVRS